MNPEVQFSVSEFVAVLNQTLEFAYPFVTIVGELANFRVSKNKWVYFDLKDESSSVKFFGTVYALAGPLEDGMLLRVSGSPRLHPLYGFSVTVQQINLSGEGSIKKAASLLEAKLAAEGLFAPERKRPLPYPPSRIGLITSNEAAAFTDFIKVLDARWGGIEIVFIDVQVQGENASEQIVRAIEKFNELPVTPEVLVLTRGGGSAEDLQAFSSEQVTRAVAASRIPTLVAIGHERDVSLAELAADQRASTPSNAAELLVPDKSHILQNLKSLRQDLEREVLDAFNTSNELLKSSQTDLKIHTEKVFQTAGDNLKIRCQLLNLLDPAAPLNRGYALVYHNGQAIKSNTKLESGDDINVRLLKRNLSAKIISINKGDR